MAIGIKYQIFRGQGFDTAFKKLANFKKPEPALVKKLFKIYKAVSEEIQVMEQQFKACLEEYAERDEHGNFKQVEGSPGAIKIKPTSMSSWNEAEAKILSTEASFEIDKLTWNDAVNKLEFTPVELMAFEPFIDA